MMPSMSAVPRGELALLAIPLLLTLAWRADGRELWSALAVWVALHDAWRGVAAEAPMVPVALAVAGVVGWTATTTAVSPGVAVLVALVAGSAAAWAAERRRERRDDDGSRRALRDSIDDHAP